MGANSTDSRIQRLNPRRANSKISKEAEPQNPRLEGTFWMWQKKAALGHWFRNAVFFSLPAKSFNRFGRMKTPTT